MAADVNDDNVDKFNHSLDETDFKEQTSVMVNYHENSIHILNIDVVDSSSKILRVSGDKCIIK